MLTVVPVDELIGMGASRGADPAGRLRSTRKPGAFAGCPTKKQSSVLATSSALRRAGSGSLARQYFIQSFWRAFSSQTSGCSAELLLFRRRCPYDRHVLAVQICHESRLSCSPRFVIANLRCILQKIRPWAGLEFPAQTIDQCYEPKHHRVIRWIFRYRPAGHCAVSRTHFYAGIPHWAALPAVDLPRRGDSVGCIAGYQP